MDRLWLRRFKIHYPGSREECGAGGVEIRIQDDARLWGVASFWMAIKISLYKDKHQPEQETSLPGRTGVLVVVVVVLSWEIAATEPPPEGCWVLVMTTSAGGQSGSKFGHFQKKPPKTYERVGGPQKNLIMAPDSRGF